MNALASLEAVANSLAADRDAHIAAAERLGEQLGAVLRAIELFDDNADRPAAEPEPQPAPKRKPFSRPDTLTRVACPDCGQLFHPNGLGPHRSRKHPDSAAKPVELRPVPSFDPDGPFGFDPDAARARAAAAI